MNNNTITELHSISKKNKPPSRIRRNYRRALAYRERMIANLRKDAITPNAPTNLQPSNLQLSPETPTPPKGLKKKVMHIKSMIKGIGLGGTGHSRTPLPHCSIPTPPTTPTKSDSPVQGNMQSGTFYAGIENSMRLRRLEDTPNLTAALRQTVRSKHPKGTGITFPCPEAVDRMLLKSNGLPTDSDELLELVQHAFARRDENFNLEDVYKDLVKTHGRIAFDHTQKWPHSAIHTRHP